MSGSKLLFDEPYYEAINEARWGALQRLFEIAESHVGPIADVNDLGAGPGWFAARLSETGRAVRGYEGRPHLVEVARQRAPKAQFDVLDFDAVGLDSLPAPAHATVCFGLIYHLENPLRAIRICRSLTTKVLFLESMTLPESGAAARLVPENPNETQGIRPLAMMLAAEAIVHGLHASAFGYVYRVEGASVGHDDFVDAPQRKKRRDMFLAADVPITAPELTLCKPVALSRDLFRPS